LCLLLPPPPSAPLFPYTTLFRSTLPCCISCRDPLGRVKLNSVSRIIYMSEIAIKTPLQYLDLAMGKLRDLGLVQDKQEEAPIVRSEEHTSELQSRENLVCRLLLE